MKRIAAIVLFLLCSIGVILIYSSHETTQNKDQDTPDSLQQPAPVGTEAPPSDLNRQEPAIMNEEYDEVEMMIYGPGQLKAGVDIPAGLYLAQADENDSTVSRVTITDSPEPYTEKPRIILTSRYITSRLRFTNRDNYIEAISKGGGIPVMPQDDDDLAKILREGLTEYADILAERYDGLVLTGGGDVASYLFNQERHPASGRPDEILDAAELALARAFIKANKPVLGICRGMQIINIAMGGELIQDIPDLLGLAPGVHQNNRTRHPVLIRTSTWLYDLFGPQINVNSTHHQCVDGVAQGFTVVAQAGPVIEAMESGNILCVQFHPERMLAEGMLPLFEDFVKRCSYKNIEVIYFTNHMLLEVEENRYIDISGANLMSIEHPDGMAEVLSIRDGFYIEGMYLVGRHLPEGSYRMFSTCDTGFSSYAIYTGPGQKSLLISGMIPAEGFIVTLKEGQYIKLVYATMTPDHTT